MTQSAPEPKPRLSPWLRGLFALSLALNVAVIAALIGAWFRLGGVGRDLEQRGAIGWHLYQELPRAERRALRRDVRQNLSRDVIRQARIGPQLDAALRADPFDADAVRRLLLGQAAALQTGQEAMREGWLDVLERMSAEDRAAYADRLRDSLRARARPPVPD